MMTMMMMMEVKIRQNWIDLQRHNEVQQRRFVWTPFSGIRYTILVAKTFSMSVTKPKDNMVIKFMP